LGEHLGVAEVLVEVCGSARGLAAEIDVSRTVGNFEWRWPLRLAAGADAPEGARMAWHGLPERALREPPPPLAPDIRCTVRREMDTGLPLAPRRLPPDRTADLPARFDIAGMLSGETFRLAWGYDPARDDAAAVERMAAHLLAAMRELAAERRAAPPGYAAEEYAAFGWTEEDLDDFLSKLAGGP
jgi:hypothetical protein